MWRYGRWFVRKGQKIVQNVKMWMQLILLQITTIKGNDIDLKKCILEISVVLGLLCNFGGERGCCYLFFSRYL